MSQHFEKGPFILFLVVLALLLTLALLPLFITPVFWSFIATIHIIVFVLQFVIKFCTTFVKTLLLIARLALKAGSSCTNTNGYREVVRRVNGVQMHLVLTIGVGFGAYRFYSLVEERPKFRLQLYIPDEPEIMPRCERSGMRLKMQSLPKYARYRPHVPSPLGPSYIKEWKNLIDFYLSKRYATEISDEPGLTRTKEIIRSTAKYRADKKTRGVSNEKVDFQVSHDLKALKCPRVNSWFNEPRNKPKRIGLSPQETLNAARAQLMMHKKWRHG